MGPIQSITTARAPRAGVLGVGLILTLLALLALAPPAQAGKGWAFKETFGEAGTPPQFGEDRSFAVDGEGRLLVLDTHQVNERQAVTIAATAGQFKLEFEGAVTADIDFNATNVQVREALRALPTIGSPNVNVTGGTGDATGSSPYNVTFTNAFAGADVEELACQPGTTPLSGGAGCSVTTTIEAVSPSLSRWSPDGSPANFAALGTNRIDGRSGADETPGNAGIGAFFLNQVAVDTSGGSTDGNIYIADDHSDKVHIFSADGAFLDQLTAAASGGGCGGWPFTAARGVAVDADGNVHFSGRVDTDPDPENVFEVAVIGKFEPSANPPVNADCVAEREAFGVNVAGGAGPSDGFLFLVGSSIEKRDAATESYGEQQYAFGGNALIAVEPITGHVFSAANNSKEVFEYDASGDEEAIEVSLLEDAKTNVQAIAPAEAGELLYVGRAATEEVDVYEAVPTPEATVSPPDPISGARATANGAVDPEELEITECVFEHGKAGFPSELPCAEYEEAGEWKPLNSTAELGTGSDPIPVRAELSGLLANGTTYNYRLFVSSPVGFDRSETQTFQTADTYTTEPAAVLSETEATLNGIVKPEGVAIEDCFFEWGETTEYGQSAPCAPDVSGEEGDAEIAVSAALSGLDPSTIYHYRLVAENALGQMLGGDRSFATLGAPGINVQIASELEETTATLQALVNPFGTETTYRFEWGTDETYGNLTPLESAGEGSVPVVVSAEISGLAPQADYHFRLVATNDFDTTEGPDQPFETLNGHDLPDNRAFELVSPADKGPSGNLNPGFIGQIDTRPSADGNSFIWPLQNGLPDTTAGGWMRMKANRVVEDDVPQGWLSRQISAPSLVPAPEIDGTKFAAPSLSLYASDDLSCGLIQTYNPITSDVLPVSVELGVHNLYLWREGSGEVPFRTSDEEIAYRPAQAGEIGYELITERLPLNPELSKTTVRYSEIDTAGDCSRVYFKSSYEWIENSSSLYEWEAASGELRDAGLRPDGSVGKDLGTGADKAVPGGAVSSPFTSRENAVTPEGDLFFTALNAAERPAIFMRSGGGAEGGGDVVEISGPEPGALAAATIGARFEAASPDGSTVFFRANHGLDADASDDESTGEACGPRNGETDFNPAPKPEQKPCDLYAYDVQSGELSDLTVDANPEDPVGAALQGTVAVDEDGSHVYFAALGQLVPEEGRSYAENIAGGGRANVYLAAGGGLAYVTNLRWDELEGNSLMRRPRIVRAQASADGTRLLYAANSRQNWYEGGGGLIAYLFDAGPDQIRCVSCRPDGEPTSVTERGEVSSADNTARVLSGRALSADGSRVFFSSSDVLMPGAEAGRPNVYEWKEGQVYFLATADAGSQKPGLLPDLRGYRGMSVDGSTAFLASNHKLAPHDRDSIVDVYAVREGGGVPFSEPPPECQVDDSAPLEPNQTHCQGERSAQPAVQGAPSAGFAGAGNLAANPCARQARRAKGLAKRAKALRGKAKRARRADKRGAARRHTRRARGHAKRARRRSKAAKRCRRARARAANTSAGGAR